QGTTLHRQVAVLLSGHLARALHQAAVEQHAALVDLEQVLGAGDVPRGAEELEGDGHDSGPPTRSLFLKWSLAILASSGRPPTRITSRAALSTGSPAPLCSGVPASSSQRFRPSRKWTRATIDAAATTGCASARGTCTRRRQRAPRRCSALATRRSSPN